MINVGWIDIYDDCLYIHDWQEWQKQWYKAMRIRTFDTERKAREREKRRTSNSQESISDISDDTPPPTPSKDDFSDSGDEKPIKPSSKTTKKAKNDYPTDFEKFWEAYPKARRIGKAEARKKYQARLNDGWTPEELAAAAKKYAAETERNRTEPRYIKHPKTFLSDSTPFADHGVPAVSFARGTPGGQSNIHCRYDTMEFLSMEQMSRDIAFIAEFTRRMACAAVCPVSRDIPDNVRKELDEYLFRKRRDRG